MLQIYHNPRCSKSRETLKLLEDAGETPQIVLYLETPPSQSDLRAIIRKLGVLSAKDMMRKGEAEYKELGLKNERSEDVLIAAMANNPRLIERPIVVKGNNAVLGRPPENALALIKK